MVNKLFHIQNRNTNFIPSNVPFNISTENMSILYTYYVFELPDFIPNGWRLPTITDFEILTTKIGGQTKGGDLKHVNTKYWLTPNTGATNKYGFNGTGGGYDTASGNYEVKLNQYYRTSTEVTGTGEAVFHRSFTLVYNNSNIIEGLNFSKNTKTSVRLIKTDSTLSNYIDYDGNQYGSIKIGNQIWMDRDYKCTHTTTGTVIPVTSEIYDTPCLNIAIYN